ncbi:MAG: hypothetical protein ABI267_05740 [Ginsengibacter sp.]
MKKIFFSMLIAGFMIPATSNAQLQKGNYLVGGDLANFNLGLGGGGIFNVNIDPKVAWFIKDNVALGGYVTFGLATAKGAKTSTTYGVGALGRYYINDPKTNVLKHGRLFFEGNVGIQGQSAANGSNTTGLGLGVGPGYAYFITPEIGLETLLKYNGIVGFGSQPYASALNLNVGFQIYLSKNKVKTIVNDVQ